MKVDKDADGEGVMHLAALGGSDTFIRWMVSKGGSLTVLTARDSIMPLQYACKGDKLDTAFLLLKLGAMASINHQDFYGYTALHYAAMSASEDFCVVLLICGADATIRAKNQRTAQEEAGPSSIAAYNSYSYVCPALNVCLPAMYVRMYTQPCTGAHWSSRRCGHSSSACPASCDASLFSASSTPLGQSWTTSGARPIRQWADRVG